MNNFASHVVCMFIMGGKIKGGELFEGKMGFISILRFLIRANGKLGG